MSDTKTFFKYVIPSVLSFALSGVYAIVDGYFVGNTIGDAGLSAINVAYPIVAVIQSLGTGIGMGGAVYYSINKAEKNESRAKEFISGSWWLLLIASIISTVTGYVFAAPLMKLLGAQDTLLTLGTEYIQIISLGAGLQILGTGLIPFMRNYGGSFWSMVAMISGFVTNIVFDYLFVCIYNLGMTGAALATVIGQSVTVLIAIIYSIYKKCFTLRISIQNLGKISKKIFKIGLAPFGLALTPNISLIFINRFSMYYGGESAVATYACIAYIICILYLVLQGVGDGSQPLMSQYYGENNIDKLQNVKKSAYSFAIFLSVIGSIVIFMLRWHIGALFGSSSEVNAAIADIMPIFLISVPFVAITRIATAGFYATEKNVSAYILTFTEPILMLVLILILPPLFGGQTMIWWSTVFARIISAILAIVLNKSTS